MSIFFLRKVSSCLPYINPANYVTAARQRNKTRVKSRSEIYPKVSNRLPLLSKKDDSHLLTATQPFSSLSAAKYDYGGLTLVEMIKSHDSYLPRNLYITMKDYVAGHSTDTVAFSFESWGLDKVFNRLVGPQPGSTKNLWNFMGRRRFPRDTSAKERKEIEDAVSLG